MRWVVYGLVGLVVVLAAAVLVLPGLIDWNPYKDRIVAEARDLLGRDLRIDGRIGFTVLPAPTLSVGQVKIANVEGGSGPHMAEAEALRVRVALLPLFSRAIQVESVTLVEPDVTLEVLADGRRNWDFAGAAETGAAVGDGAAAAQEEGFFRISEVRIERFSVTGGRLTYSDARDGTRERIEQIEAIIAAESLAGPFKAQGGASIRGQAVDFDLGLGRMVRSGAMPFNATLALPEADAELRAAGSLSNQPDAVRLRAQVKAEGSDLSRLLGRLEGASGSQGGLMAQPFLLEAEVAGDETLLEGKGLTAGLGELSFSGGFAAKPGEPLELSVDLRAGRIDLDALLASGAAQSEAAPSEATDSERAPSGDPARPAGSGLARLSLPDDLRLDLALFVEGAVYRGQPLRQIALEARLDGGRLDVSKAEAQLPAGSEFKLAGSLALVDGVPGYDARVSLTSDNARGLAEWLGADLSPVPSSRLRRLDFSGRVHGDAAQLTLADLTVRLDLSRITGGLVAALRERPGLGIGLAVDSVNLDAYLPEPAGGAAVGRAPEGAGSGEQNPAAAAPELAWLDRFDANLDLRLGSLTTGGTRLADLKLDATWRDGALTVREASIGELAGGRAHFAGRVDALATPPSVDGTLDLRVSDPLRLAKAVDLDPAALGRLGAFGLTAGLRGSLESLALDSELTAHEGRFGFSGTLAPSARPVSFDLGVTARHPDLARLAAALDLGPRLGGGLGGLDLKGRVAGTPLSLAVSDLIGTAGPLAVKGRLSADLSGPETALEALDLDLHLVHGDLGGLSAALGAPLPAESGLGPVDLRAKLTGDHLRPALEGLSGTLGPATLTAGTLGADLSGERPRIDANIEAGTLPIAALGAAGAGEGGGQGKSRRRWSTRPIDLAALRAADGTFDIRAQRLTHDKLVIETARIEAELADGLLELRRLTGTLAGGALQVSGKLAAGSPVTAGFAVTAIEVQAEPLLKSLADFKRLSGPVTVEAQFSTEGDSEARLVAGLNGTGRVKGKLEAKTKSEERVGALALGLLGAEVKTVENLSQATLLLFSAFADTPADLSGSFTATNGVLRTEDLRLEGRGARIATRGQAHLPAWNLDATSVLFGAERPDKPSLTLRFEGPLDDPDVKVVGLRRQRPEEPPAPEQPKTKEILPGVAVPKDFKPEDLKPEDVIKNLLKGLGN